MPDREKVIRGLEVCTANGSSCDGCPYYEPVETIRCDCLMMEDALALLREQEPVEPIRKRETGTKRCGICGTFICAPPNRFCPNCGRKVKR